MIKRLAIGVVLLALSTVVALADEQTVTLAVDKMSCALCPITVTKAIKGVPGVQDVSVDYEKKTAVVVFDGTKTNWEMIAEASTLAGYPASKVE